MAGLCHGRYRRACLFFLVLFLFLLPCNKEYDQDQEEKEEYPSDYDIHPEIIFLLTGKSGSRRVVVISRIIIAGVIVISRIIIAGVVIISCSVSHIHVDLPGDIVAVSVRYEQRYCVVSCYQSCPHGGPVTQSAVRRYVRGPEE